MGPKHWEYYINIKKDSELIHIIVENYKKLGKTIEHEKLQILKKGIKGLKNRVRTTIELVDMCSFYIENIPINFDKKSKKILIKENCKLIGEYIPYLEAVTNWNDNSIEKSIKNFCDDKKINLGQLAQPLRAALTGKSVSPGLYEVILALGMTEVINRINFLKK